MKKKVAILSWYGKTNVGGVERVVGLLEDLLSEYYDCMVVDENFVKHIYKREKLWYDSKIGKMLLLSFTAKRLKKAGYFLIGNGFNAPFVQKDICIAHGTMYGLKKAINQFAWGGSTIFEALAMKKSDRIIAVSQETRKALIEKYRIKENRIDVIENCVDCKMFFPLMQDQDCLTIIFCGRLEERKGIDRLCALAKKIDEKNNIKLKIAAPVNDNVEMFSNLKNTEICVGLHYSQMNQFYNSGNVMFFPSKSEGYEMVTLECLAAGIPVVGNYVGAVKELVDENFPGVFIAKSDEEELLVQLRSIAMQFQSMQKRELLHETVNRRLGKEQYKNKMYTTLAHCINKQR